MKIIYKPKFLFAVSLFLLLLALEGRGQQCATQGLPFIEEFNDTTLPSCWIMAGTKATTFAGGHAVFNPSNVSTGQAEQYVLRTDTFHLDTNAMATIRWSREMGSITILDSLRIRVRDVGAQKWLPLITLKKWNFFTHGTPGSHHSFEYLRTYLDTSLVGKDVFIRIDFFGGYNLSKTCYLNFIKVEAIPNDTIFMAPFIEPFDSSNWKLPMFLQKSLDTNWKGLPVDNEEAYHRWTVATPVGPNSYTGPISGHNGSSKFIQFNSGQSGTANLEAELYTPFIDISNLAQPELSFWYHMFGSNIKKLNIDVFDGFEWQKFDSIVGEHQFSSSDSWLKYKRYLPQSQNLQVRFRASRWSNSGTNSGARISIDDFEIKEGPVCKYIDHHSFTTLQLSHTFAQIGWQITGADYYTVEYGSSGFQLGFGQKDSVTNSNINLSSLSPNSCYDIYVRTHCIGSNDSIWAGPFTFCTYCTPVTAPYQEDFSSTAFPLCWNLYKPIEENPTIANWRLTSSTNFPTHGAFGKEDHTGNGGYAIGVDGLVLTNEYTASLLSPLVDVTALIAPELRFWVFSNNTNSPGNNNIFQLDFYDGQHWNDSVIVYAADSSDWVEQVFDISQQTVYGPIMFRMSVHKKTTATFYNDIIIDDISIDNKPGFECTAAQNFIAQAGCTDATLSWTSDPSITQTTKLIYGPSGFDPTVSGTTIQNPSNPVLLTGLTNGNGFDIYLYESCQAGDGQAMYSYQHNAANQPDIAASHQHIGYQGNLVDYQFNASNTLFGDTYSWDLGNGQTPTGKMVTGQFNDQQQYTVKLTASNSCGTRDTTFVLNVNRIGLQEDDLIDLKFFPNPTTGLLHIETKNAIHYIEVSDLMGRVLLTVKEPKPTVNLSRLPNGVYLVKVTTEHGEVVRRVVKE